MYAKGLVCVRCGEKHELDEIYACKKCGNILKVEYDYSEMNVNNLNDIIDERYNGMWRYKAVLPIEEDKNIVSFGEGNTPIVKLNNIYSNIGFSNLYIKSEFTNPSGSFKDRPTSVGISVAKAMEVDTVAVASSGNTGPSVASYAAKARMKCLACVPETTPRSKIIQLAAYGAKVSLVDGAYSDSYNIVSEACKNFRYTNLTSTHINAYTLEGDKTVGYEIYEQLNENIPDWIIVPIGAGPLLTGVWNAFCELKEFGLIDKLPRMVGVQAESCSPVVKAYMESEKVKPSYDKPNTIASGIADQLIGYTQDGDYTLSIIKASKGIAISLTEEEILDAWNKLSTTEGVFGEPTSAAAVGAVEKLYKLEKLSKDDCIVSVITGHGLKATGLLDEISNKLSVISSWKEFK